MCVLFYIEFLNKMPDLYQAEEEKVTEAQSVKSWWLYSKTLPGSLEKHA